MVAVALLATRPLICAIKGERVKNFVSWWEGGPGGPQSSKADIVLRGNNALEGADSNAIKIKSIQKELVQLWKF